MAFNPGDRVVMDTGDGIKIVGEVKTRANIGLGNWLYSIQAGDRTYMVRSWEVSAAPVEAAPLRLVWSNGRAVA